jgi:hypothetical protein
MAEKRGQIEIGEMEPRKTRMTRSRLDCLNPNPDRGTFPPIARPIDRGGSPGHDVIEYQKTRFSSLVSPLGEIPGHRARA